MPRTTEQGVHEALVWVHRFGPGTRRELPRFRAPPGDEQGDPHLRTETGITRSNASFMRKVRFFKKHRYGEKMGDSAFDL